MHDGWRVTYAGRLVLADALRLDGDLEALLDRPAVGRGARALATVVLAGWAAEPSLERARQVVAGIGPMAGVSLIGPVLVARLLAPTGARLRRELMDLLAGLLHTIERVRPGSGAVLPRLWHF